MSTARIVYATSTTFARQRATMLDAVGRIALAPTHSCWHDGCDFTTPSFAALLVHEQTCAWADDTGQ
jgi:hypothetical protein